ncbi:MAG: hypothetical protein ACPGD8_06250, partial [Flavobacteriales bacterium]
MGISDFYNEYWTEFQSQNELVTFQPQVDDVQTLLADLDTSSKVAPHRFWIFLFSVFSWFQVKRFNSHKAEIEAIANAHELRTPQWWVDVVKTYQHGHALDFVDNGLAYSVVDEAARVVKRSACVSLGAGHFQIKIAGDGTPLDNGTAPGVADGVLWFAQRLGGPGPDIDIVALNADRLRLTAMAYVDPLLFTDTGESILVPGTYPIEDAVNDYLKNIPFNGTLSLTKLVSKVEDVTGVYDFVIQSSEGIQGVNTYPITRLFSTIS